MSQELVPVNAKEKISPQESLMNCLAEADRIQDIVILVYTKDGWYEAWSNDLPYHVRTGLIRESLLRADHNFNNSECEEE